MGGIYDLFLHDSKAKVEFFFNDPLIITWGYQEASGKI